MSPGEIARLLARWLLAAVLVVAGVAHLGPARAEFRAQVPGWVPEWSGLDADLVVVVSGVVEIGLGLALLVLRRRRVAVGVIVALFFVAVFPGNVHQYVAGVDAFGLDTDTGRAVRLAFQPLLVLWALWCTGFRPWRARARPPSRTGHPGPARGGR